MSEAIKFIGIDPDMVKSGVSITDGSDIIELRTVALWDMPSLIDEFPNDIFVIEDVNFHRPIFARHGCNAAQMQKIAQNVGMVKGTGKHIVDLMARKNASFILIKPLEGTAKKVKHDEKLFKRITGWDGRSNEDTRDATMIAFYGARGQHDGRFDKESQ